MIKKKAKSKNTGKRTAKPKSTARKSKKELNPAEVRQEISKLVQSEAVDMAKSVIGEGKKGQLATVKYLYEVASIFPAAPGGEQATEEEDCLAKLLLAKIEPAKKAEVVVEEEQAAGEENEAVPESAGPSLPGPEQTSGAEEDAGAKQASG